MFKELFNRHRSNGNGKNGAGAESSGPISLPETFLWTLEIRRDQHLIGTMHSPNPFLLISYFREYSILYGKPQPAYSLWLQHRGSNRRAVLSPIGGAEQWLEFLRQLDPSIDTTVEESRNRKVRTNMSNADGFAVSVDEVLGIAFGAPDGDQPTPTS